MGQGAFPTAGIAQQNDLRLPLRLQGFQRCAIGQGRRQRFFLDIELLGNLGALFR